MSKLQEAILRPLETECRARCMDDDQDRMLTAEALKKSLAEPLAQLLQEAIECCINNQLDEKERVSYVQELVGEMLKPGKER